MDAELLAIKMHTCVSIDTLHVLKSNNPSPCRVLPVKIHVMCLKGFHATTSLNCLQVMTQIPTR